VVAVIGQGSVTFTVDAGSLTLMSADGNGLQFIAQ
jgi:hypothetical protein